MDVNLTEELRNTFTGIKVSVSWWGVKKSLAKGDKESLAASAGVDKDYLDARRSLIDTSNAKYKACTAVRSQAKKFWKDGTLGFPEPGIRLLPTAKLDEFSNKFLGFSSALDQAVAALSADYALIASKAREACKYNRESDYPQSISDLFSIGWEVANLEPPEYLKVSHQRLYERESARCRTLLEQTITNAEQTFFEEFQGLLQHLVTHLGDDKQFHKAQIDNLKKFFGRFRELNVTGNDELEALVAQSEALVSGVKVESLKDSEGVRNVVREAMGTISGKLDDLVVNRPKRAIRFED